MSGTAGRPTMPAANEEAICRPDRTPDKERLPTLDGTRNRMTTVTHEIDGKVGVVTLAKPPHNLLDDQLINDLIDAYRAVVADGCRAILLRSAMRHFCAGAEMASWGTGTTIHM